MSFWHPNRPAFVSLDGPPPVGFFRTFTAGEAIAAWDAVSLSSDGNVYKASSTYPNVVGVATTSAAAGENVKVLVFGAGKAVADGVINPGDRITFSTATAGRVVAYGGHSHSVTKSTGTAVTGVSVSTASAVTGITKSTSSFVTSVSADVRDFTTASAVTSIPSSTDSATTGVTVASHSHSVSVVASTIDGANPTDDVVWDLTNNCFKFASEDTTRSTNTSSVSPSVSDPGHSHGIGAPTTSSFVTGITTTAGTTVVAGVSASTATALTDVTTSTGTFVTGVSKTTGTFLTNVTVNASSGKVLGIALSAASAAGETVFILVLPTVV